MSSPFGISMQNWTQIFLGFAVAQGLVVVALGFVHDKWTRFFLVPLGAIIAISSVAGIVFIGNIGG